ncbi:MAG TPA: VOC family protein [Acidimicrobiales bacterium]|nr:VOC family protein [Acidimicrobiales bacterium]
MAVGRLSVFALDCPDPHALAVFYAAVTGWEMDDDAGADDEWVEVYDPDIPIALAFQRVPDYRRPEWPGAEHPQQAHLDVNVTDLDAGEAEVLRLGAVKAEYQPGTSFRVFLDPVGHPFCLVLDSGD